MRFRGDGGWARRRFPRSVSLVGGVALGCPVRVEIRGQQEHTQMREAHGVDSFERGPEIGTARERAAAAVQDEIRRFGNGARPFLQIIQALWRRSRPVERCSGNVPALVEKMRGDANHCWLAIAGEFLGERRGLDGLCSCPRVWFWRLSSLTWWNRRRCHYAADGGASTTEKEPCGRRSKRQCHNAGTK